MFHHKCTFMQNIHIINSTCSEKYKNNYKGITTLKIVSTMLQTSNKICTEKNPVHEIKRGRGVESCASEGEKILWKQINDLFFTFITFN